MNLSLGPLAERIIREKLQSGEYETPEDIVLAGLEALKQQADDFAPGELAQLMADGEESLRRDGAIPLEKVVEEMEELSRRRREQRP